MNSEKRLIAGEGLWFEVAAGVEPGDGPFGEGGAGEARVGPFGAVETGLLVAQPLLGIDLAIEGLIAGTLAGDGKPGLPPAAVGLDDPPCHGNLLSYVSYATGSRLVMTLPVECDVRRADFGVLVVDMLGDPFGDVAAAES